jgi:hypothetical protein
MSAPGPGETVQAEPEVSFIYIPEHAPPYIAFARSAAEDDSLDGLVTLVAGLDIVDGTKLWTH